MSEWGADGDGVASGAISQGVVTQPTATYLQPGQALGDYTIVARLGAGGMGEVYEAVHTRTQETVALKVLKRMEPAQQIRFKREFRVLAQVRHENLVRPRELIATDECFFFTMDLCDGPNLIDHVRHEIASAQLPNLIRLRRALRQLVAGVSALHNANLLHRDLKPSNVLVTSYGLVRILDFGLVRDVTAAHDITAEGQLLGTPAYMSPEQAAAVPATPATDWYAVGIILYELLTGQRPFQGPLIQMMTAKSEQPPPDPRSVVASAPADLAELTMSLMAVEPEHRPGAKEILDVLGVEAESDHRELELNRQPLVGRQSELSALRSAYDRVRVNGQSVTVHVQAESGMGKSKLISEFLANLPSTSSPFILRGRCF
ncbi:MAG: serine/threonine-protein kinase, partial [Nannocystaceae bacterium]